MSLMKLTLTSIIFFVFMAGCASSSVKQSCQSKDWKEYGVEEGRKGASEDQVLNKERECAKAGITIPIVEYKEGWLMGINEYCSPENALELGKKKAKHHSENCPVELRPKFDESYAKGLELANIDKQITNIDNKIESVEKEKANTRDKISSAEKKVKTLDDKEAKLQSQKKDLIKKVE